MRLFNRARCVCFQNFRKWSSNYRVWVIAILVLILSHSFTQEIGDFAGRVGIDVSPWIFPFLYNQKYVKLLFYFPLILLFCDAPFVDDNQPYVIARSGRISWSIGQIGYIILTSGIYFIFLMILTILVNLQHMQFIPDWGKVLGTLANTDAARVMKVKISISSYILQYFTPLQAMWFTFLLSWFVGIFLGMLIYVINSLSNTRVLGVLAASFFLVLDATVNAYPNLVRFSPVTWSTLDRIDVGKTTQFPSITYIYIMFAVLIIGLIISAVAINRKQSIHVLPPV